MSKGRPGRRKYELTIAQGNHRQSQMIYADNYMVDAAGAVTFFMEGYSGQFDFCTIANGHWISVEFRGNNEENKA